MSLLYCKPAMRRVYEIQIMARQSESCLALAGPSSKSSSKCHSFHLVLFEFDLSPVPLIQCEKGKSL